MKIVYLHQYFNTPSMGSSTRSYELARRLVHFGHEVHMVTSYRPETTVKGRKWFQTVEEGIQVHWLPVPYSNFMSYYERIKAFIKFATGASLKAATIKCDLIYATSTPLTIALPAVYAARKQKIPMVFEVRDLWPEIPIAIGALRNPVAIWAARKLEKFAYSNAKRIIALSPGMKVGISKAGYPFDQITVIPNSCDLELFTVAPEAVKELRNNNKWLQNRRLVIYTGTIGLINGVDYLARLAGFIRRLDDTVCFLIIGSGQGERKLREEAEAREVLNKNLFIMPRIPKKDIPVWIAAADIATSLFIDLKEMWSNSANKFFDALAAGTPIAINYGGWQAEMIKESGAGLVLDPHDIESSAVMLIDMLNDQEYLDNAGAAARKLAEQRFDRGILAKELNRILIAVHNQHIKLDVGKG